MCINIDSDKLVFITVVVLFNVILCHDKSHDMQKTVRFDVIVSPCLIWALYTPCELIDSDLRVNSGNHKK